MAFDDSMVDKYRKDSLMQALGQYNEQDFDPDEVGTSDSVMRSDDQDTLENGWSDDALNFAEKGLKDYANLITPSQDSSPRWGGLLQQGDIDNLDKFAHLMTGGYIGTPCGVVGQLRTGEDLEKVFATLEQGGFPSAEKIGSGPLDALKRMVGSPSWKTEIKPGITTFNNVAVNPLKDDAMSATPYYEAITRNNDRIAKLWDSRNDSVIPEIDDLLKQNEMFKKIGSDSNDTISANFDTISQGALGKHVGMNPDLTHAVGSIVGLSPADWLRTSTNEMGQNIPILRPATQLRRFTKTPNYFNEEKYGVSETGQEGSGISEGVLGQDNDGHLGNSVRGILSSLEKPPESEAMDRVHRVLSHVLSTYDEQRLRDFFASLDKPIPSWKTK